MRRFLIQEYETVDVDLLRTNPDHVYAIEITLDRRSATVMKPCWRSRTRAAFQCASRTRLLLPRSFQIKTMSVKP
jgi:hypothetical protein